MIEIKPGWTGLEAANQFNADAAISKITQLKNQLEVAQWQLNTIQLSCDHRHVVDHMCEVCGTERKEQS
jgi:hypothetical protein